MAEIYDTLYVVEDDPPPSRPRWYCAEYPRGFDDVDEAVAWVLTQARTAIVRTVGGVFYYAGEAPSDPSDVKEMRAWPPSAADRAEIDAVYEQEWQHAQEHESAWERHVALRDEWLGEVASHFLGSEPAHRSSIETPDGGSIEFEEYEGSVLCSAWYRTTRVSAFGRDAEVIAKTSGREVSDPWVEAVTAALARERTWPSGRRGDLEVRFGAGEMFHVTRATNRDSIRAHGLDWKRMTGPGIAGSTGPELDGIFLCDSLYDADFFASMPSEPIDIWAVQVDGLVVESGPDGWWVVFDRIPLNRLRLAVEGHPPSPEDGWGPDAVDTYRRVYET